MKRFNYDTYYPSVIDVNEPQLMDDNMINIYQFSDDVESLYSICNVNKATQSQCGSEQFWKPILLRNNIILPSKSFNNANEWITYFAFGKKVNAIVDDLFEQDIIEFNLIIPIDDIIQIIQQFDVYDVKYGSHVYFSTKVNFIATRSNMHFGNEDDDSIYQIEINSSTKHIIYKVDMDVLKQMIIYFYMNRLVI